MNHLCRSSLHRTYGILSLLVFCQIQSVTIFPLCHICRLISLKIYQLQVWESKTDSGPTAAESSLYGYSRAGTEAPLLLENIHSRSGISLRWILWINIDLKVIYICRELQKPRSKHRNGGPLHVQNRSCPKAEGQNSTALNTPSSAPAGKAWREGGCFCQSSALLHLSSRYHLSGILARRISTRKGREQDYFIKWLRHCVARATITPGLIWNAKREVKLSQHWSPGGEVIRWRAKISTLPHE